MTIDRLKRFERLSGLIRQEKCEPLDAGIDGANRYALARNPDLLELDSEDIGFGGRQ
jgi:hypothetical protein